MRTSHSTTPPSLRPWQPGLGFIVEQCMRLGATLVLFDVVNLHVRWNPLLACEWDWGLWDGRSASLEPIMCVAFGISLPHDWPPLFGRIAYAASVQNFWALSALTGGSFLEPSCTYRLGLQHLERF
ncbi:hypothetical protein B0H11DRAFT_2260074 [Mycena galericulata]|nr:hypothetical protein B0H11DRAFT_2260074 [Mycena galericulata]